MLIMVITTFSILTIKKIFQFANFSIIVSRISIGKFINTFLLWNALHYANLFLFKLRFRNFSNNIFFSVGLNYWIDVFIVPVSEEIIFREILCKQLSEVSGSVIGIIFSSIIFGLFHTPLEYFQYHFFEGLLLGIIYIKTKNLYISIFYHALHNCLCYI